MELLMNRAFAQSIAKLALLLLAVFFLNTRTANADTISFSVVQQSPVFNQNVAAGARITTAENSVRITLGSNIGNPASISQALSGFVFTLSTGQTQGTLTSSSGFQQIIGVNSFTNLGVGPTGWILQNDVGGMLQLCVACGLVGPAHTIIYEGYLPSFLDSSIAGSNVNNPFIVGPASFDLFVPGVTHTTYVSSATFIFGTTDQKRLTIFPPDPIPEPATLILLGTGLAGVGASMWKRRKWSAGVDWSSAE
jgi:hypothetical protein